jgi:hypothetical protein
LALSTVTRACAPRQAAWHSIVTRARAPRAGGVALRDLRRGPQAQGEEEPDLRRGHRAGGHTRLMRTNRSVGTADQTRPGMPTMRTEFSIQCLESLNGKRQSFPGGRSRKLQTHRMPSPPSSAPAPPGPQAPHRAPVRAHRHEHPGTEPRTAPLFALIQSPPWPCTLRASKWRGRRTTTRSSSRCSTR